MRRSSRHGPLLPLGPQLRRSERIELCSYINHTALAEAEAAADPVERTVLPLSAEGVCR